MEIIICDVLISGGTIITQNSTRAIIQNGSISIKGSEIIDIGNKEDVDFKYSARKMIDARGKYIFPGLINTHTHLFQTFIKGLGEGLSLYQWVDGIAAPSAFGMSEKQAYLSTILGGMEAIHCGTTTLLDFMYSMPHSRLHRQVGNGLRDVGLSGLQQKHWLNGTKLWRNTKGAIYLLHWLQKFRLVYLQTASER